MNIKPMRFWLAAFAVTSLAACNSNDHDSMVSAATPTPAMQADSFTTQVATDVATTADEVEPNDIDGVVLATADDAEPVTVN